MTELTTPALDEAPIEAGREAAPDKPGVALSAWTTYVLAAALLLLMAVLALASITRTSPTTDEVTEVGGGYDVLRSGDFSAAGNHPFLLQAIAAAPLLTLPDLVLPSYPRPYIPLHSFTEIAYWQHGVQFFMANSQLVDEIVLRSRLAILLLAVILGITVFSWSRQLYGPLPALLALFLFVLSPNVLAHASVATLDLGFSALTFITCYAFWKLITRPHASYAILTGIALGLTMATKANAPIISVVLALLVVVVLRPDTGEWRLSKRLTRHRTLGRLISFVLSYAAVVFIALVTINLLYGFAGAFQPLALYFPPLARGGAMLTLLGRLPVPLPEQFTSAVALQINHAAAGHAAFLAGRYSPSGWSFYHAATFLFKVPIPTMILLAGAAVYSFLRRKENGLISTAEVFLLIPAAAIFMIISFFSIKVGFRHILPVMPFLFVYASKLGQLFDRRHWPAAVGLGLLVAWYFFAAASIYPHFLSYFNELAGGPDNGYRYLVDSNIDWGQDLKGLKEYMEENNIDEVQLSFFGSADPSFYDIDYSYLPSVGLRPEAGGKWWYEEGYVERCEPVAGVIAVSVTNLQGPVLRNRDCFAWLRDEEPDAKIGYSIFIFDIDESELE